MTFHFDTLEYANALEKAGIQRAHAEALANGQAGALKDLVDKELVTQSHLRAELAKLEATIDGKIAKLGTAVVGKFAKLETTVDGKFAKLETALKAEIWLAADSLRLELRSLKYAATLAAFAVSLVVLMSRLIR